MENDEISDDRSSTIEVSYPEDLNTDILEVYFQGPGPGGNHDKAIEWIKIFEPGKCQIKFESDEGIKSVNFFSHMLVRVLIFQLYYLIWFIDILKCSTIITFVLI